VAAVRGTELAIIVSSDSTNIGVFDGQVAVASSDKDEDEEDAEAEGESAFMKPTTAYDNIAPAAPAVESKKEVLLNPNNEMFVAPNKEPEVKPYLSRVMEKEKRRAERLKQIAEKVREKLNERNDYLQTKISEQQEKLNNWEIKREERLKRFKKSE